MTRNSTRAVRAAATGMLPLLFVGLAGCPDDRAIEPWQPMHVVVSRINENNAKLDYMLKATGSAKGTLAEPGGAPSSFDLNSLVLYRKPRGLFMKLEHTFQPRLIELGSNDEEFWFWDRRSNPPVYKWGRHDRMAADAGGELRLRPDQLLEVLGLNELPIEPQGERGPYFRVFPEYYELVFLEEDASGRRYIAEAVHVGRREPFLPEDILFYAPDGHPVLIAKLSDYKAVEAGGVLAPRMIRVDWPEDASWFELRFSGMERFDNPAAYDARIAQSPLERGEDIGLVIRVDRSSAGTEGRRDGEMERQRE